ncbi:MAG: insulinase family protein [Saprospiraceae bacterium]|nr:insulinase family protein [Pyrinomonadaceae bacterium]
MILIFVSIVEAQTGKIDNIAQQAALVTEFDVNGMKVIVKRRAAAPTVAAGLFIRGGARNITDKNSGIENLMLTSAVEAGKTFPRQTVRREMAGTGSSIGAGAGRDFSTISFASTRTNFDRIWEIFTDVAINPAFLPEDVDRVRAQTLAGLRESEISPDGALQALSNRVVFTGHPYANDVIGNSKTISAFTAADLRAFHQKTMQTSRLLLVVVGDIDPNDLKARVTASFGKLPRGEYKEQSLPALDFSKGTVEIVPRAIQTNYVQGNFDAPALSNPDYFPMRVATTILQQLVYEEVRVKRQLSYAPNAELNNFAANTANIYVTAVDANQAVKVMLEQINMLKGQPIREDVIAGMAGQFLTNYYIGQETNSAQVGELARYELIGGGWRNSFEFLNRIREVKPGDVQAAANKYMKNIRFAVVGESSAINKSLFLQN